MWVIVEKAFRPYGLRMIAALVRFVTLLALVLMPFGMVGTPAAAKAMPADHATMQMGHCDEQPQQDKAPGHTSQQMHCAMCTALAASEPPAPPSSPAPRTARIIAAVSPFNGIELEIATPPPRLG